jgi:hypothetical protein
MADSFELYRLSLLPRTHGDLFADGPDKINREQWLREVFGKEQPFSHRGSDFHYVPTHQDSNTGDIIGKVGRKVLRDENKPPSEGLEDITHEAWMAAMLVLDPTHHDDGQKLAIQSVNAVGKPIMLVKSLVSTINERSPHGPYLIQAAQIIEEQSFWDFVKENEGKVTSLTLDFIVPNMFGSSDEFSNEIKEFRDNEEANNVKLTIKNEGGIKPDTKRMKLGVQYATRGGGKIRAKAGKKFYNSANSVKRSYLDDVKETGTELVSVARKFANRILGRE